MKMGARRTLPAGTSPVPAHPALDPTVQAEILDLLRYLQEEYNMALLLITHDIGVVAEMAERVMVMYTGKIVETADIHACFGMRGIRIRRASWDRLPNSESAVASRCVASRARSPIFSNFRTDARFTHAAFLPMTNARHRFHPPKTLRLVGSARVTRSHDRPIERRVCSTFSNLAMRFPLVAAGLAAGGGYGRWMVST